MDKAADCVSPEAILNFWFGETEQATLEKVSMWWKKDLALDQTLKTQFEPTLQAARAGHLTPWLKQAESCLAYIVLLDQFSRNIYRDTARAFAQDAMALSATMAGLEQGFDTSLSTLQCSMFYMPFMHSEETVMQQQCVALFKALHDAAEPPIKNIIAQNLDYAHQHKAIIDKFGRYPHRNALLGRDSTAEERAFLQQPGSSF